MLTSCLGVFNCKVSKQKNTELRSEFQPKRYRKCTELLVMEIYIFRRL